MSSESNTTAREKREGKRKFEELRALQLRKRKRRELPSNQLADRHHRQPEPDRWRR
jgi:hypothetical protein